MRSYLAACKALERSKLQRARNNALHTQPQGTTVIVAAALGAQRTQGRDGLALSPPNNLGKGR